MTCDAMPIVGCLAMPYVVLRHASIPCRATPLGAVSPRRAELTVTDAVLRAVTDHCTGPRSPVTAPGRVPDALPHHPAAIVIQPPDSSDGILLSFCCHGDRLMQFHGDRDVQHYLSDEGRHWRCARAVEQSRSPVNWVDRINRVSVF